MDILEMIPFSEVNMGFKYILICIDIFSRFVRVLPLLNKSAKEVVQKLRQILESVPKPPRYVQTDLGKEFYNAEVRALFREFNIKHYSVDSQFKAAIVERFNRTLREKLNRWFTYKGNKVWYEVLPSLIEAYNNTEHRGIYNMKPSNITQENEYELWRKKELEESQKKVTLMREKPINVGDYVRLSRIAVANPWVKNFDQNWTEEVFRVTELDNRTKPLMYKIEDLEHVKNIMSNGMAIPMNLILG